MQQNTINTKKLGLFAATGLALCAVAGVVFRDDIASEFNTLKSGYEQKKAEFYNATRPEAVRRAFGY